MGKRPLSPDQRSELDRLRDETLALLAWYETYQDFSYAGPLREATECAHLAENLRELRALARELRGMLGGLPPALRREVLASIEQHSRISLNARDATDETQARAILARGRIRNDREYYLLRGYLDRIEADPERAVQASEIMALLDTFGA